MKLTLWIHNKHILCFNLTIILIVYQNLKQHVRQKIISGGIHIKKLYKYIPFSVCISCNGFFNLCNFPFYLKHKTCFYSSPKFHYKSVSNWEKIKDKVLFPVQEDTANRLLFLCGKILWGSQEPLHREYYLTQTTGS